MEDAQAALIRNVLSLSKAKGLSLNRLADAAGISHGAMSYFARGQTVPTLTTIAGLARALDVPVAALFWPAELPPFDEAMRLIVQRTAEKSAGAGRTLPEQPSELAANPTRPRSPRTLR